MKEMSEKLLGMIASGLLIIKLSLEIGKALILKRSNKRVIEKKPKAK